MSNLEELFVEAKSLPSNWHRRDFFFNLAVEYKNNKNNVDKILQNYFTNSCIYNKIKTTYCDEHNLTFIVANKNIGDRINFIVLALSLGRAHNKKVNIIMQNDALSHFLDTFESPYLNSFYKIELPENDFVLALQNEIIPSKPFLINWWSFPFQSNSAMSLNYLSWNEFINSFKYSLSKWDMLYKLYNIERKNIENLYLFKQKKNMIKLFLDYKLRYGKSILLSPIANTLPNTPEIISLFDKIVNKLQQFGYSCIENLKPGEKKKLNNTVGLEIEPDKLPEFMLSIKNVISFRSGFSDLAYLLDTNLFVIYPFKPRGVETVFAGWGKKKSNNVHEFFLSTHSENEIISYIIENLKED